MKKLLILFFVTLLLSPLFSTISTIKAEEPAVSPSIAPQDFKPQESGCVYAGSDILVIEDVYTWGMEQLYNAPDGAACSDLGISYDVMPSGVVKVFTQEIVGFLHSYKAIVLMADQPQGFYENLYACKQELSDYVSNGGVLSAVVYRGWIGYTVTQQFLPGGVILNFEYCDDVDFDSTHFIISNPDRTVSLDGPWGYNTIIDNINQASSFYFTNLPSSCKSIAKDAHGHDVFVEYSYGDGRVLAVGIPIQWFYRYKLGLGGTGCQPPWDGANNLKLLYNELLYQSGLISIKDRLLRATDELKLTIHNSIHHLGLIEAKINAIAYSKLQFNTMRFVGTVLLDLASGLTIGSPPEEVKDLLSWKVLNSLSKTMMYTKYGIKTPDAGLSFLCADDYIKSQGLSSQSDIEWAYYKYIMGIAPGQVGGEEEKIPFVQDTTTFHGLKELLDDIIADYSSFSDTLKASTIPETESNVELIQCINNLRTNVYRAGSTPSLVHHISVLDNREQFCDNELGYLLNFEKQQDELVKVLEISEYIGDVANVLKTGAVIVKVINLLSLGAATGVQLAVTCASTIASVMSTGSSSVDLLTKTHIFKNKVMSTMQMGSEAVHLKQIIDDTESYVLWRISHVTPSVSGTIIDFSVPEVITDGLSGSQQGTVTVKNTGSTGVWAMAHVEILGPASVGGSKMAVYFTAAPIDGIRVEPGSEQAITFDYSVLDLSYVQGCNQYEARAFVSLEGKMIGPTVRLFKAGCGCQSSSTSVLSGEILGSQTQSTYITMGTESVEAEFDLSYLGSDLDLHIYDQLGNHVGMNYDTMSVEFNIPGAAYSGNSANPEWVRLPVTGGSVFRVAVVGVSVFGAESFVVTLTEYPHYRSPSLVLDSTHKDVAYGEETEFQITLQNRGNVPDSYHLTLTGLDETWFSLSQSLFSLDPGSMTAAVLTIHPQGIGTYSFSVTAKCVDDLTIFDQVEASLNVARTCYQITVTASPAGAQGETFKVTYTKCGTTYTNVQKTTPWNEWVDECTWVTLTAPLETKVKYHFAEWTVDGGATYSDNTITVHMDGPKTATVVYKDYLGDAKEEINCLRTYVTQLYNNRKIGRIEYNHFMWDLAKIEKNIDKAIKNLDTERAGYDDKMRGFEDLRHAVMKLKHMIKDVQGWARRGRIPAANATWIIGELENIRMKLVSKARAEALAERALALKAIEDAKARGKDTTKAEEEIANVDRELAKAEQKIAEGKLAQAIQHFKHAFAHSQHAVKKAYDPTWTIDYKDWIDELEEMDP